MWKVQLGLQVVIILVNAWLLKNMPAKQNKKFGPA